MRSTEDDRSREPVSSYDGQLEVARTARYSQVGRINASTRQLWIVCHGYRQLASRFVRWFHGLVDHGCVVVAPEALNRFYIDVAPGRHGSEARIGASWMTRADRESEIRDYVRYLDRLTEKIMAQPRPDPLKVVALGFSQGAHTAARWAALGSTPIDELVLWGAYYPSDVALDDTSFNGGLTLVYGDEDPTRDMNMERNQERRLAAAGRQARRVSYPGGHAVHPDTLLDLSKSF